ncbi:hypothetical protein Y032_0031g2296 [Ancylostoma ceylanicum]|nr:hypothetical protein Y032_0031g2296 [Ancylostoma ceylanicum]
MKSNAWRIPHDGCEFIWGARSTKAQFFSWCSSATVATRSGTSKSSMKHFLLICAIVAAVSCDGPVYVDELEDLVPSGSDRYQLKLLDDDDYMTRSEKQQRLNAILSRQPAYIQQQYQTILQYEQSRRASKAQYKQQRADQLGLGSWARQMDAIDNDMSISEAEADRRENDLKRQFYSSQPGAIWIYDD